MGGNLLLLKQCYANLTSSKIEQETAQQLAVQDAKFRDYLFDEVSGDLRRTEIMAVRPTLPSDVAELDINCDEGYCYRVELYNYALNVTTVAIVDVNKTEVLAVNHLNNDSSEKSLSRPKVQLFVSTEIFSE